MARLEQILARNLGYSRSEVRRLLDAGRVCDSAGEPLDRRSDATITDVLVDGEPLRLHAQFHCVLNKPLGCVTALRDDRYPTAYALVEDAPLAVELRAAGRLDIDTTGLLIFTTDGQFIQRITHPKREVPRTYHAALARPFTPPEGPLTLDDGHQPDIRDLRPVDEPSCHPALQRPADATAHATITIVGGAYHEVRRIFAALDSHVLALCRVSYGRLALPEDLPAGEWREIDPASV